MKNEATKAAERLFERARQAGKVLTVPARPPKVKPDPEHVLEARRRGAMRRHGR